MRTRDIWILLSTLGAAAALGLALVTQDTFATAPPPVPLQPDSAQAAAAEPPLAIASDGVASGGTDSIPAEAALGENRAAEGAARTTGVVRGDIQLAVSVLDRIQSLTVAVEEARAAIGPDGAFQRPHRLLVPVKMGRGTPTFEVTGIPFSQYPYVVSVYAPGLNGSRRTVVIDAEHPVADDIVLSITPGAPFSVLLRDQDGGPHVGIDVRMTPAGEPAGRTAHAGTSDNFGSVVFENVLAGDYQIVASQAGQPLGEPQRITVQPGNFAYQTRVQGQGHTLTLPRGVALELHVSDAAGYGVADVRITATATDRTRLTVLEATTDFGGRAEFTHMTPGVWQLDLTKDDFQRSHRMVTIRADQPPASERFRLVRLR